MMRVRRNSLMSRQVRFRETFATADAMVVRVATAVVVMAMLCSASGVVEADEPPTANRAAAEQGSGPAASYGDDRFRFGRSVRSMCFSPNGKELVTHGVVEVNVCRQWVGRGQNVNDKSLQKLKVFTELCISTPPRNAA